MRTEAIMRRRIFRAVILITLLLVVLLLHHYFGLVPLGPRFRFRTASAWSSAIRRGETILGYPQDEQGMPLTTYLPDDGTSSYYFRRLKYRIWPDNPRGRALKQMSWGPDGTRYHGIDVHPGALPVLIVLLNDDDERVRNEAAYAIGIIGARADTSSAIPKLIAMLTGSRAERLNAAFALGQLGTRAEVAIPVLKEARESDDFKIRQIATEALQRIAPDSFPAN
jgi:hypothetical protein